MIGEFAEGTDVILHPMRHHIRADGHRQLAKEDLVLQIPRYDILGHQGEDLQGKHRWQLVPESRKVKEPVSSLSIGEEEDV